MEFRNGLNFFLSSLAICVFLKVVPCVYDVFVAFSVTIVGLKLAEWLMTWTRIHFLYNTISSKNKAVFITGCDSGFGNKLAKRMDSIGYKVFAACLDSKGEGAKELLNSCTNRVRVISLDVTNNQSIQEAKEYVEKELNDNILWAIVNNAGVPHAGEIDWTPLEVLQQVHDVNATGTLRVTKAFLPLIKKSKGRIINNTSICGHFICPGFVGYCMSKSAAVTLTTGLRIELAKWGIKAISIEPFFYATPLTRTRATCELVDKTWRDAPKAIREEYGEHYKESLKGSVAKLLSRCNPNIDEVIDCFEDAITADEPLPTYFPSNSFDKIGIKLFMALPSGIMQWYLRRELASGVKPAALLHKTNT